LDIVMLKLPL